MHCCFCFCCCSEYERMYGETLLEDGVRPQDDRDRQQMLQAKVRQLITKKQQLTTHTRPAARPGSGGRAAAKPLQNVVTTMPGHRDPLSWLQSKPPPGGRRLSDENEQPGAGRQQQHHHHQQPATSTASQQQQQPQGEFRLTGQLWKPPPPVRASADLSRQSGGASWQRGSHSSMPDSPGRSQASRASSGASQLRQAPAVLLRQIELKAALRPPIEEQPHKSPWRPPGAGGGSRRRAACMPLRSFKRSLAHLRASCATSCCCLSSHVHHCPLHCLMLCPMRCPAGKNEKIISSKRQRQSWTPALPLFRPGFASQDNSPDGSEGAPSDTASAQGSPAQQVGWETKGVEDGLFEQLHNRLVGGPEQQVACMACGWWWPLCWAEQTLMLLATHCFAGHVAAGGLQRGQPLVRWRRGRRRLGLAARWPAAADAAAAAAPAEAGTGQGVNRGP